jgi:hypothetical protein
MTENQRRIHSFKFPSENIKHGSYLVMDFQLKMKRNGQIKNKSHILENVSCDTENRERYLARLMAPPAVVQEKKVKMF